MMIRGIEDAILDWKYIGEILANKDDGIQARFFVGFLEEMLKYPTKSATEMQAYFISKKLSKEQKYLLKIMCEGE